MRIISTIVFFFLSGYGYTQNLTIPSFETNATCDDTLQEWPTLFSGLNKFDFSISEIVYTGHWSKMGREYDVIANKNGKWYKFYLYQPFTFKNGHIQMDGHDYIMGKPHCKFLPVNDSVCKEIFNSMLGLQLLSMNEDSLNKHDGIVIFDGADYVFLVNTPRYLRSISCYAPDEYWEHNAPVLQRKEFIDFRNLFESYWKK